MTSLALNTVSIETKPHRPVLAAMLQGCMGRCPNCKSGRLFNGFLAITPKCSHCHEDYSHHRADDAPPYFTIFIVGHIVVSLLIWSEITFKPALWIHMAIWIPITIAMSLAFLRPIKGAIVALQWANYMHGFDPNAEPDLPEA
ncbi:DUF983 domain-containing protein [Cohaesibacter celericrescens]|nr:DUF983 domain-containing protein [Cohaesibacter celericrescens]